MRDIVRQHGVPLSIVTDRHPRFTSGFSKSLQRSLGTNLRMSIAYHPQTDIQSKGLIYILEDILTACGLDFDVTWGKTYTW